MSYVNMMMYGAVLPSYKSRKDDQAKKKQEEEVINADDPKNFDKIRDFFYGID